MCGGGSIGGGKGIKISSSISITMVELDRNIGLHVDGIGSWRELGLAFWNVIGSD